MEVKNVYFEPIPLLLQPNWLPLASTVITEEGACEGGKATPAVVAMAWERRRQYERLFFG